MKMQWKIMVALLLCAGAANAALTLTIDEFTTTKLTFTVGGTLDTDTVGDFPGYFAVKANWDGAGTHTEWMGSGVSEDSWAMTVGGVDVAPYISDGTDAYEDSIYWMDDIYVAVTAGTVISGTGSFSGTFTTVDMELQLLSGYNGTTRDWQRLEATGVVPEPATAGMLAVSGLLIAIYRRCFGRV